MIQFSNKEYYPLVIVNPLLQENYSLSKMLTIRKKLKINNPLIKS